MSNQEPRDPYCQRAASQIDEFVIGAADEGITPAEFAREDGTFNTLTDEFACTACHVSLGMPSTPGDGWKAGHPIATPRPETVPA